MKKTLIIFFSVLFVFAAITVAVSAAKIDVDDKGIYYTNLLDFNPETNALWAEQDADGNWVGKEIDIYEQPIDEHGNIISPILSNKYYSYSARKWSLIENGEVLRVTSTDNSVYPGMIFVLDADHSGEFKVGQESGNPAKAEYVKIRVRNFSTCDQISFGFTMNHTNNGNLMPVSTSELTVDANGKRYESSGEWQTYIFSMYELNMNTNYNELLYDPEDENATPVSRWPGYLYEFAIYPFGYDVTDGTGNYAGATLDIDYIVIGSRDYVTHYQSNLEVKESQIQELELIQAPTKTRYYVGEMLDLSGLELVAKFKDGTTETITTPSASVATFESADTTEVTLKYGAESVSFPVTVVDVVDIQPVLLPQTRTYEIPMLADPFPSEGYQFQVNYADGTSQIIDNGRLAFRGDFTQVGQTSVSVYYYGHSTDFAINLIGVENVRFTPTKTYRYGDTPRITDFDITFVYTDGSTRKAEDSDLEFTYDDDDLKSTVIKNLDTVTVTIIAYHEYYDPFIEEVVLPVETPAGIEITKEPKKTEYEPSDPFDPDGMEISLIYNTDVGKTVKITMDPQDYNCVVSTATSGKKRVNIRTDIVGLSELFSELKPYTVITVSGTALPDSSLSSEIPFDEDIVQLPLDSVSLMRKIVIHLIAAVILIILHTVIIKTKKKKALAKEEALRKELALAKEEAEKWEQEVNLQRQNMPPSKNIPNWAKK